MLNRFKLVLVRTSISGWRLPGYRGALIVMPRLGRDIRSAANTRDRRIMAKTVRDCFVFQLLIADAYEVSKLHSQISSHCFVN